jgi:DNA-binding helix-hairpin-helix protein with protein kinase domain
VSSKRPSGRARIVIRHSTGARLVLPPSAVLGAGGEGKVYGLAEDGGIVAKLYHRVSNEKTRKLVAMIRHPPQDPMLAQGHRSFAWPLELLGQEGTPQRVAGFLMPRVSAMRPALEFFNPAIRRQKAPLFNYLYLHRAARNLSAAIGALHDPGHVMGDVNESNVLVGSIALVTLVDTDSYQITDPVERAVFRCPVGKPEFTPPELQGVSFRDIDRTPFSDRFGLAVLVYQLLMEGHHPFAGVFQGAGDPPPLDRRIAAGHFPLSLRRPVPYHPAPIAPSFEILHPALRDLFRRCFDDGHADPALRPEPRAWVLALKSAEEALRTCGANDQHRFGQHLTACPWCERTRLLQRRDPFPSREAVARNEHLIKAVRAARPAFVAWPLVTAAFPGALGTSRVEDVLNFGCGMLVGGALAVGVVGLWAALAFYRLEWLEVWGRHGGTVFSFLVIVGGLVCGTLASIYKDSFWRVVRRAFRWP